MLREY